MNAIKELKPDTRYHRICLNSPLENQHANVKQKLSSKDLLFVMERLKEESLLLDAIILDDLRFYGFSGHIKTILAGPGLFLKSSIPGIFSYLQALINDPEDLAVFIISKVPDLIFCLDDEVKARYGLWAQLVKEEKWRVLREHKKYIQLEKAGKRSPLARRELVIAGEYFRIFRHPGWENDLVFVRDDNNRMILTYEELIKHGFYQQAVSQYDSIARLFPETAEKILEALLKTAGEDFLCQINDKNIKKFLISKGCTASLIKHREWVFLAEKGLLDLIDWEDFAKNFTDQQQTFTSSVLGKDFVWGCAYKAGKGDFLLRHRQYRFFLKLKWKRFWEKDKKL